MSNITSIVKAIKTSATKHAPEILTGIGISGMAASTVLGISVTPKAIILLEQKKLDEGVDELAAPEIIKTVWYCYIPTVITGVLSAFCLIGANSVHSKRTAALATAYTLTESTLKEYREKVVDAIGKKKEQSIREDITREKVERDPVSNHEVIITGKGDTLCYDAGFGRYFKSDIDKIKRIENQLNSRLMTEMFISLNEFYYDIGLSPVDNGNDIGWDVEDGLIELEYGSVLAEDGTPCLAISYHIKPRRDYYGM